MGNLFIIFCLLSFGVILSVEGIPKGLSKKYLGCYVDVNDARVLRDDGTYLALITIEKCMDHCIQFYNNNSQIIYFGLEFDRMCYCGRVGSNYRKYGSSQNCNLTCEGNETQICGGHQAISVYEIITPSPCGPPTSLTNGYVNLTDNNTALISCFSGYQLQGSRFIHCNLTSLGWDIPKETSCMKNTSGNCQKLENPLNGTVHQDEKQANFSCDQSYVLDGEGILYCNSTGDWSTGPPDCVPEQYLTTMLTTDSDKDTDGPVLGLPIHTFAALLLVALAVLVVIIIILINLIVKTTTETKRIKTFKTDSTCAEQRSQCQGNNESYWKSHPDLLKTSKFPDAHQ